MVEHAAARAVRMAAVAMLAWAKVDGSGAAANVEMAAAETAVETAAAPVRAPSPPAVAQAVQEAGTASGVRLSIPGQRTRAVRDYDKGWSPCMRLADRAVPLRNFVFFLRT